MEDELKEEKTKIRELPIFENSNQFYNEYIKANKGSSMLPFFIGDFLYFLQNCAKSQLFPLYKLKKK